MWMCFYLLVVISTPCFVSIFFLSVANYIRVQISNQSQQRKN